MSVPSETSELCKVCRIKIICHEPEKYAAKSCQHFEGTPPPSFYRIEGSTVQFVQNHWKGNKGYFVRKWGRQWVSDEEFRWMIESDEQSRRYMEEQRKRREAEDL